MQIRPYNSESKYFTTVFVSIARLKLVNFKLRFEVLFVNLIVRPLFNIGN